MRKSRTIFIWDVHWCFNELKLLLEKLNIEKNDMVYFVWDLINKWPKSYKVIKLIYDNQDQYKAILWNHEVWFLNWIEWNDSKYESKIYRKLKEKLILKPEKIEYLKNLPAYIETDNFLMIHWWLMFDKKLEEHTVTDLVNLREYKWKPWYEYYKWEKKIIYWHNAIEGLQIREKTIWLDSWCVYWKSLTAYILETWDIFTQNALNIYENVYKNKKNWVFMKLKNIFKII